jgi:hypothetical protein
MLHRACAAAAVAALSLADNASAATPATASAESAAGCFAVGGGYLRARIRGAVDLDLNWKNADMQCEGGPRPSGNGVRVSIGGPARGKGNRIRLVFGVAGVGEGRGGKALRTNVTLLFEGEQRIFATQGDDKCTVDTLSQERVEVLGAKQAVYRVVARGFCVGPATNLTGQERVVVTSFDFAGRVEFSDDDRHVPPPAAAPTASNY